MEEHRNLDLYLQYKGDIVPPDADLFSGEGVYSGYCILCYPQEFTLHHEYELIEFVDGRQLHICSDCSWEKGVTQQAELLTHDETSIDLHDYIVSGILPRDAASYINTPICVLCKKHIDDDPQVDALTITLPVQTTNIGGRVFACSTCADACNWREAHWRDTDNCISCTDLYPISEQELEYRVKRSSLGYHLCYGCFINTHGDKARFTTQPCKCAAQTSLLVDLTLRTADRDYNPRECGECKQGKPNMVTITNTGLSYPSNDHFLLEISETIHISFVKVRENGFTFEIIETDPYSNRSNVVLSGIVPISIIDASTQATSLALEYIENRRKKQLTL